MANATTPASPSTVQAALKLLRDRQNKTFSEDLWYIILSVLAVMTLAHITVYGLRLLRKHRDSVPSPHGPIAVRRLPLAAVNAFRIVFFRWTVPFTKANLADALFTLGYTALMLTMSFISSHDANITLWSSRTGAIAISQLALLPVLASKNNIISLLTGISHEKMAFLHRAAGRNMLLLLWIHAVGKWYTGTRFTALKAVLGGIALFALSVTFLLSLKPIRSFVYELFLVTHIVLIAIFMVCGWYHVEHTHRTGYWVWAGMILWAFDRLLRFARTIYNARLWSSKPSTEATIELISEDTIRVTMERPMSWTPGQHAFLTFPGISANPVEAHPFTIATIPREASKISSLRELSFIIRGRSGFTGKLRRQAQIGRSTVTAYVDGPYGAPPDLSSFSTAILIAGGSGVSYTISMFENLIQQACNGTSTVQRLVFVWSIRDESHISWIYHQLNSALACVPETLSVSVQIFVTRAPSPSSMKGIPYQGNDLNRSDSDLEGYTYENVEKADVRSTPGRIWSNVTRAPGIPYQALSRSDSDLQLEDSTGTYNNSEKANLLHSTPLAGLRVMSGRPDVYSIIAAEVATSYGAVSVDVSGPAPMIASVRAATRASDIAGPAGIARGMPSISLHAAEFRL
ncbi:hypothetical protein EXIGLDRAFT_828333 [Exidia glandulosa HHB12029]|uniref:ferric-chelate reductase (NADPH) n=1 Tax=Exidia glandulosa HHB12029 TaxID=1314781 RepID=A0A165R3W5_EXIGL|nr:hypothetical protein EXIGLDRAFT_828333 [Exidia glandulosa HHB12029]